MSCFPNNVLRQNKRSLSNKNVNFNNIESDSLAYLCACAWGTPIHPTQIVNCGRLGFLLTMVQAGMIYAR